MVTIETPDAVTLELEAAFARLVPQLSTSASIPHHDDLAAMINSSCSTLLIARDERQSIVGALTLVLFRIPTGLRAWIEDVVVDENARGKGIGEALNRRAIELANAAGARTVDLTSRSSRAAANRLYQKLGFELRDTNVYRLSV
jgi:ribosomal protein S18 acetylase RimI-like enzyme